MSVQFVSELPKSRRGAGRTSVWQPILDQLTEAPDQWAVISEPSTTAYGTANNLRAGNGPADAEYDTMTVNGEEVKVPSNFEIVAKSVGPDGEPLGTEQVQKRDGTVEDRPLAIIYARALTDETRKQLRNEKRKQVEQRQKRQAEGQ